MIEESESGRGAGCSVNGMMGVLGIGSPGRRKQRKKCRVPYSSESETSKEINILLPLSPTLHGDQ